jgi:hypothetical protein
MPSVDEHGQFNLSWSTQLDQSIHRRPHCATGVKHIVDEHDNLPGEVEGDGASPLTRQAAWTEVVSKSSDVQLPHRDVGAFDLVEGGSEIIGEGNTPGTDADQYDIAHAPMPFDYLMSYTTKGTPHIIAVHQLRHQSGADAWDKNLTGSFPASQDRG